MKNDIFEIVKQILADQLKVDLDKVKEEAVLTTDLGADSLDLAEIALLIKEKFAYDLKEDEISRIKTVRDVVDILVNSTVKI